MKPARLLISLFAALLFAGSASAQTFVWIGPGANGASAPWGDPANWDTGAVPAGPAATALFNMATNQAFTMPIAGGARPVLTGNVTLGAVRYDLPAFGTTRFTGLTIGQYDFPNATPGYLRLEGAGLDVNTPGTSAVTAVSIAVRPGSTLEFAHQAVLSRSGFTSLALDLFGSYEDPVTLRFLDDSSVAPGSRIGLTVTGHVAIEFRDRSRAGDLAVPVTYNSTLTFFDDSSAENATLTSAKDGSGAGVTFNDRATAATARLDLREVTFNGQSAAATATINNSGYQNYSGHGQYTSYFTTVTFNDSANADNATITGNAFGSLAFNGNSTAASALITSSGTVTFADRSSFGAARLFAGGGSYYEGAGYNQSREVATGRVVFKDQATGGLGRIDLTHANAVLDFSGLYATGGTAGRALLPVAPSSAAVVPDDRVAFSLGSIASTAPGGTIHLGGTVLALGADNRDMMIGARILEEGGLYGTAAGAPVAGGQIYKVGAGTLTLTNPDNNFPGGVGVFGGTLNLAGGAAGHVTVLNGSRLTGQGTIKGHLTNGNASLSGIVSPGNSTGTIAVQGSYIQAAGSTLNIEVASATDHDRLVVGGSAFLNGTLNLSFLNGYVPVGSTSYDFITSPDIHGQFSTVHLPTGYGVALATAVTYPGGRVSLQVTQKPFVGFAGGSAPAAGLAAHLDATTGTATGGHRALLASLNLFDAPTLSSALSALAPDRYTVLAEEAFGAAAAHQAMLDRCLATRRNIPASRGLDLFFEAGRREAKFDTISGLSAAGAAVQRGTAGGAWRNDTFLVGAAVTQESSDLELDALGSRAETKRVMPAVFFQYAADRLFLQAGAAFSQDDFELSRRVVYPGVDLTALAAPSGRRTDLAVTAGYDFASGAWSFTPQAGLLHSSWNLDAFTETGAGASGVAVAATSLHSTRLRTGFEVRHRGTGSSLTPRFSLVWLHELKDVRDFRAGLVASGTTYTVAGREAEKDLVQASLSLEKRVGRHIAIHLMAAGAWGRSSSVTSDLSAGLRWEF